MIFASDDRGQTGEQLTARPRALTQSTLSIWDGHDEAVSVSNSNVTAQGLNREANRIIMTQEYNILPILPRDSDPLMFWRAKDNEGHFTPLVKVVMKFLCIPATSVPCSGGNLVSNYYLVFDKLK